MYHSDFIDKGQEEFCCQFSDLQDHLWSPLTYDHQRFFNFFPFHLTIPLRLSLSEQTTENVKFKNPIKSSFDERYRLLIQKAKI